MKDVIFLYEDCCIYEIAVLNYFLKLTGSESVFCSIHGETVRASEGYSINADCPLENIDFTQVRSFIVPGGEIANIDQKYISGILRELHERHIVMAGICAAVDLFEQAGILKDVDTVYTTDTDCVRDGNIITARANAYVDFAIETAKKLELFEDEKDLQETISFWKEFKRIE